MHVGTPGGFIGVLVDNICYNSIINHVLPLSCYFPCCANLVQIPKANDIIQTVRVRLDLNEEGTFDADISMACIDALIRGSCSSLDDNVSSIAVGEH